MPEECKKIILTTTQKLDLSEKFEEVKSVTTLAKDYETEIQTIHDTKNNKINLIKFVRNYDSDVGLSNCKHMKMSSYVV
jgi:ribosomal protein L7/L12